MPLEKVTQSDKSAQVEEGAKAKLSKAKRRRLRKKKLHQGPQEDGGEAQAELPPEGDLQFPPAVAVLVKSACEDLPSSILVSKPETQSNIDALKLEPLLNKSSKSIQQISEFEIQPISSRKLTNKIREESVNKRKTGNTQTENISSKQNLNECAQSIEILPLSIEGTPIHKEGVTLNIETEMSAKEKKRTSTSNSKNVSPGAENPKKHHAKNPKASLSEDMQKSKVTKNLESNATKPSPVKHDSTQLSTGSQNTEETTQKSSLDSLMPQKQTSENLPPLPIKAEQSSTLVQTETVPRSVVTETTTQASDQEMTREQIIAERKAKKAEKAAKKGKGGKENSKPQSTQIEGSKKTDSSIKNSQPDNHDTAKSDREESTVLNNVKSSEKLHSGLESAGESQAVVVEEKSKAALKEERRLKQEAQRAAKASSIKSRDPVTEVKKVQSQKEKQKDSSKDAIGKAAVVKPKASIKPLTNLAKLLQHLQRDTTLPNLYKQNIHPAIIKLGLQYSQHEVAGSNARAVALMRSMKKVIEDYQTPPQSELSRDLESRMGTYMEYLDRCRPVSVSMKNAMRDLKNKLSQLPSSLSDKEAKKILIAAIDGQGKEDGFIEKIDLDCRSISFNVLEKIKNEDVILTYGCSSLVQRILVEAQEEGKKFRVVVVGARPWREAEKMLRYLTAKGLKCTYLLISAVSSIMKEVNKVLLGAHAILANGYVMARAGSSQVALLAHNLNVPVIVCCETYKFCDRVQTDAFVYNELGESDELVPGLKMPNLTQCVLAYDVTPPELVSTVVTEVSMLPCSSIPVVLHMQSSETRLKRRNVVEQ